MEKIFNLTINCLTQKVFHLETLNVYQQVNHTIF